MVADHVDNPKRILVFRIGQLGDIVVSLPAFWSLRESFPSASLTLLTNQASGKNGVSAADVVPPTVLFDEIITYRAEVKGSAGLISRLSLAARLRRGRFDRAYYLMPRNRTPSQISRDRRFLRLSGIRTIAGIDFLEKNLLAFPIPVPTPTVTSEAEFLIEMLRSEGLAITGRFDTILDLSHAERQFAAKWLGKCEIAADRRPLIAVAPGSNWRSKTWAEGRFASVVNRLIEEFDVFPIIIGGQQDQPLGSRLIRKWRIGANAAGELTVRQSAAVLELCQIFLGNDTGTMHLAAAVGTPCVAVFAAVDWIGKWAPFGGERNRLFRAHVDCEGCHREDCPYGNKCLELTSVDEVYSVCADLLGTAQPSNDNSKASSVSKLRFHA